MQASKSPLEALWFGELCPGEEQTAHNEKQVDEIIKNIEENKEKLKDQLTKEQYSILTELLNDLHFLYLMKRCDDFKKGFSLASKLLAEAFSIK